MGPKKTPDAKPQTPEEGEREPDPEQEKLEADRLAHAESWFKASVQNHFDEKERIAREEFEKAKREKDTAEAKRVAREKREAAAKAWRAEELRIKTEADGEIKKLRQLREKDVGRICWPLRAKPIYLSYADNGDFQERRFVSALIDALHDQGFASKNQKFAMLLAWMFAVHVQNKIWVDKDEGVLNSPYCSVDRADALGKANAAIIILSEEYMKAEASQIEIDLLRARTVGNYGDPLVIYPVAYHTVELIPKLKAILPGSSTENACFTELPMEQRVIRLAEKIVDGLQTVPYCDAVKVHTSVGDAEAKFVKSWLDAREVRDGNKLGLREASGSDWSGWRLQGGYKLKRAMEWTPSDLSAWMEAKGKNIAKYSSSFLKGKIDGFTLLAVTDAVLEEEYGIATSHHRARLRGELAEQVERDSTRPVGPSITSLTEAELQDYIMDLFLAADLDGNGVLDREEMRLVLSATYLNLSKKEMHHIMAEADEDDNGVIDFSEFVPLMVNLVKMTKAKEMAQKVTNPDPRACAPFAAFRRSSHVEVLRSTRFEGDSPRDGICIRWCIPFIQSLDILGLTVTIDILGLTVTIDMLGLMVTIDILGLTVTIDNLGLTVTIDILGLTVTIDNLGLMVTIDNLGLTVTIDILGLMVTIDIFGLMVTIDILRLMVTIDILGLTTISNIFSEADKDGNGKLDRMEFKACLRSAELGLTRKEINVILSNVDLDSDGCISYNEFIPCCFDLLVERFKEDLLASNSLNSADGIVQMLLKAFAEKDEVNEGKLPLKEVKHTLQELAAESFGLSRMQLVVIMAEAKID
eukprot:gene18963-22664_t